MEQRQPSDLDLLRSDAQLYMELKGKKKMLDDEAKGIKDAMDLLEQSIIERMTESEFDKFAVGGYTYSLLVSAKTSVPVAKREAFYNELRERGLDGIIKETIDPRTLADFVKEQSDLNGPPDWIEDNISTFTITKLSARKA